jgi:hypothetical protein
MEKYFNDYIGEQLKAFNFESSFFIDFTEEMRHLTENEVVGIITSFNIEVMSFEVSFPSYGVFNYPAVESIKHITSL